MAASHDNATSRSAAAATAQQVRDFLRAHPDFLLAHPDLLATLTPPSHQRGDRVVDMQRFMLERLRGEVARVNAYHAKLIEHSRDNLESQSQVHGAALVLLECESFEQMIEALGVDLAQRLNVDAISLCVEDGGGRAPAGRGRGVCTLPPGLIDKLVGKRRDILLRPEGSGEDLVFGAAAALVRSSALCRLKVSAHAPPAMLALGSRRADKFSSGQRTDLLAFLSRVVEICLRRWLGLPA